MDNALMKQALAVLVAAAVAGCTVGPDYARPDVDTPSAWRIDYPKAAEVANTKWWEQFGDPVLNGLVETALRENRDIRIAAARVDQFAGALVSTRSQSLPQLGYGADASRAQASRVGQPPIPPGADNQFTLYQASLGASWQLDLFGRVRRLSEAAQAQVYASEQAQRGVVLSVVTSVAASYIGLRALDRQLEIARATARNFGETARIFDLRFKAGIVSQTEVVQILQQLHEMHLTQCELTPDAAQLFQQADRRAQRKRASALNPMSLRVPLFDPAPMLRRLAGATRQLFTPAMLTGGYRKKYYRALSRLGALAEQGRQVVQPHPEPAS